MINPSMVITALVAAANTQKATLGITKAIEISEEASTSVKPPYLGVFADTTEEAEDFGSSGVLVNIPIEIKCIACSAEHKTAAESFAESWTIAQKVLKALRGDYDTLGIRLAPRKLPIQILRKASDQSVVQVNFFYTDSDTE